MIITPDKCMPDFSYRSAESRDAITRSTDSSCSQTFDRHLSDAAGSVSVLYSSARQVSLKQTNRSANNSTMSSRRKVLIHFAICILSVVSLKSARSQTTAERNLSATSSTEHKFLDRFSAEQNHPAEWTRQTGEKKYDWRIGTTKLVLKLGVNYLNRDQLEAAESFYFQRNTRHHQHEPETVSSLSYTGLKAKLISQPYSDFFIHRYDSLSDIERAAGPQVSQELCISQLELLNKRADENLRRGAQSEDLNFAHYIDTFGGSPTGRFSGNFFSVGSYEACKSMRISVADGQRSAARYCIGSLRYKDWLASDPLEGVLAIKTGLCLPASCDSLDYKNKFQLIKQLNDRAARPLDHGHEMELTEVYCPPDERSELGSWWRSRPTLITISLACLWLLALVAATVVDEWNTEVASSSGLEPICHSLSILNNLRSLFRIENAPSKRVEKEPANQQGDIEEPKVAVINLDVLSGIKVLAAIYIMSGHMIMIASGAFNNYRELAENNGLAFNLTNGMPGYAVNVFFVVTGILNAYLIFSRDPLGNNVIKSPIKWLTLIIFRYLRLMPVYALVTVFCKHVARYIGDGPLWDYGTSSLAARRECQDESWAWTLLFGANYKPLLRHCVPPAWYLANDFQFFLVTPIFVAAMHFRPRLGKILLVICTVAGYLAGIWRIQHGDYDLRPVSEFMPHGFMVFINYLDDFYTGPHYRIPAYLVGLLMGYLLHEHEQKRRTNLGHADSSDTNKAKQLAEQSWPKWMIIFGPLFTVSVIIGTILTPYLSPLLIMSRDLARVSAAIFSPNLNLLYSLAIGVYIMLASTGHGNQFFNRFLSLPFWKPMSRLGLCVMLVNIEVIAYLTQTGRTTNYMDNYHLTSLSVMACIYSYMVAMFVYILLEAPIKTILDEFLIGHLMARTRNGQASKAQS